MAAACVREARTGPDLTWVADDDFLVGEGVVPYRDLPLWMPVTRGREGCMRAGAGRAAADGPMPRDTQDTVADTLAFGQSHGPDHAWRAGPGAVREQRLLDLWRTRMSA